MPIIKYVCEDCGTLERVKVDADLIPDHMQCNNCGGIAKRNLKVRMQASSDVGIEYENEGREFMERLNSREDDIRDGLEKEEFTSEQAEKFKRLSKIITGGRF